MELEARGSAAGTARPPFGVLVVDDSEALRVLVQALIGLERDLEVVGEAADGETGLALAERTEADALLLDVAMPKLDGLEVLERLQGTRPALSVIVYSGLTDPEIEERARALGADDYVVKGIPPHELVDRILAVCRAKVVA